MPHRRHAAGVALLVSSLTMGCAGGSGTPAPQTPSGGGGATASGPRLHWDQSAPDAQELARYAFVLYVDGTPMLLAGSACGSLDAGTLTAPCSAPLPVLTVGTHVLEMATRLTKDGAVLESARSAPITYAVGGTATASETQGATDDQPGAAGRPPAAGGPVVTGLDSPSALARLPDGRLLIADRGGKVHIAADRGPQGEIAAWLPEADADGAARVGIAVAPDFHASRHVFVSYARVDAEGARRGRVVRFRESAGSLGEMAVVIDDLSAEPGAPLVRVGPDGKLYVGTSASIEADAANLGSYAGKILRLNPDGTTPVDNPVTSSPVYASGFTDLHGFGWSEAGVLWHAEGRRAGAWLGRTAAGAPVERLIELGSSTPSGLAFTLEASAAEWRGSLFVGLPDEQCVLRVSGVDAPGPAVERVACGLGRPVAVLGAGDSLYVAVGGAGGEAGQAPAGAVYRISAAQARR